MKKIIAFTLICAMLLSLAGCGIKDVQDKIESGIQGAVEDAVLGAVENKAEKMNAELGRGKIEGNVLNVEAVGITFVKPYSWEFLEDDAIKEMAGSGGEVLEIGDFASKIAETKTVYDAVAKNPVSGANIIFMYENLAIGKQEKITVEQYVDAMKKTLEGQENVSVTFGPIETAELSGKTYHRVAAEMEMMGSKVSQVYYLRKIEGYMHAILCTLNMNLTTADVEYMFTEKALQEDRDGPEIPFEQGSYDGEIYKNGFAELTFEKPADLSYLSGTEMANEMGVAGNALSEENIAETFATYGYVMDMYAEGEGGFVFTAFEDTAVSGATDIDTYMEFIEKNFESDDEITYTKLKAGTQKLSGQDYAVVIYKGMYVGNVEIYQASYAKLIGNVAVVVNITAASEASLSALEACFK